MSVVEELLALYAGAGEREYGGERVSQRAHALQCAWLAERDGASDALVVASLLHDLGHLLGVAPGSRRGSGVEAPHEESGAAWLAARGLGPAVTEPVRLHVAAKRHLCAVEPGHVASLSRASVRSLALQGGTLAPGEAEAFLASPFAAHAVRLRRWDDAAKVAGLVVPGLEHYRARLGALARRAA